MNGKNYTSLHAACYIGTAFYGFTFIAFGNIFLVLGRIISTLDRLEGKL